MLRYWEKQLLKQAGSDAIKDQLLSLPEEMQQQYFQQLITDESPEKLVSYGKQLLQRKYRTVTKQIKQMAGSMNNFYLRRFIKVTLGISISEQLLVH